MTFLLFFKFILSNLYTKGVYTRLRFTIGVVGKDPGRIITIIFILNGVTKSPKDYVHIIKSLLRRLLLGIDFTLFIKN